MPSLKGLYRAPLQHAWVLLLLTLGACSEEKPTPPAPPPMPVTVLEVHAEDIPSSLEVMGQTEGARETEVRARVGGILLKRLFQEGDSVRADQPLFQIDPATYEIAVSEAQARVDQARREMQRVEKLARAGIVARKIYDDAQSELQVTLAGLRQAQLNLSWTTVRAPVAGITGRALLSEGNLVSSQSSLLTSIYQNNPIWVRFSLGESDLQRFVHKRATPDSISGVQLSLSNGSPVAGQGRINFLASTLDPVLGTQQMRAEFDNADNSLVPGQFVRVRLFTGMLKGVFRVPQSAILETDHGATLYTLSDDGKATPKPVKTGAWSGKDWIILDGLHEGDRVIIDNLIKLRPGMPVTPKAPDSPAAAHQG